MPTALAPLTPTLLRTHPAPRGVDLGRGDLGRALHFDDDALVELVVEIERDCLLRIVHVPEDQSITGEERPGGNDAGEVRAEMQPVEPAVRLRRGDCDRVGLAVPAPSSRLVTRSLRKLLAPFEDRRRFLRRSSPCTRLCVSHPNTFHTFPVDP